MQRNGHLRPMVLNFGNPAAVAGESLHLLLEADPHRR
jgi:hypothetical protein